MSDETHWVGPLPKREASSPVKIKYLREFVRPYARDLAMEVALGRLDSSEAFHEIAVAIIQRGFRIEATDQQTLAAYTAEWGACLDRARTVVDRLRKRIRQLAWERAKGQEIIYTAEQVLREADMFAQEDAIVNLAREIAQSTIRPGGRRVG